MSEWVPRPERAGPRGVRRTHPSVREGLSLALAFVLTLDPASLSLAAPSPRPRPAAPSSPLTLASAGAGVRAGLQGLPLAFVENQGQADPRVAYYVQGAGNSVFLDA